MWANHNIKAFDMPDTQLAGWPAGLTMIIAQTHILSYESKMTPPQWK